MRAEIVINNKLTDALEEWNVKQRISPFDPFFLFFKTPSEQKSIGDLAISQSSPGENWCIATDRPVSPGKSIKQNWVELREIVNTLPIIY